MGAYERLVADDEVVAQDGNGSSFNEVVESQERAKKRRRLREKFERLLWILGSASLVAVGDGSDDLVTGTLRRYKERKLSRLWFILAIFSFVTNGVILGYLIVVHQFHRRGSKWADKAAWALPTSSCLGATSFVGFGIVLWPVYGWATPVVEVVLCMGFLMAAYFLPIPNGPESKAD